MRPLLMWEWMDGGREGERERERVLFSPFCVLWGWVETSELRISYWIWMLKGLRMVAVWTTEDKTKIICHMCWSFDLSPQDVSSSDGEGDPWGRLVDTMSRAKQEIPKPMVGRPHPIPCILFRRILQGVLHFICPNSYLILGGHTWKFQSLDRTQPVNLG